MKIKYENYRFSPLFEINMEMEPWLHDQIHQVYLQFLNRY